MLVLKLNSRRGLYEKFLIRSKLNNIFRSKAKFSMFKKLHKHCSVTRDFNRLTIKKKTKNRSKSRSPKNKSVTSGDDSGASKSPSFSAGVTSSRSTSKSKSKSRRKRKIQTKSIQKSQEMQLSKQIIDKIRLISKIPTDTKLRNSVGLKQVYKTITEFYEYKLGEIKQDPAQRDVRMIESMVAFFSSSVTVSNIIEKRVKMFLISCFAYRNNHKVQLFLRFLKLIDKADYMLSEERLYLRALEYVTHGSKRGFRIKPDFNKKTTNVPYIRCIEFCEKNIYRRLDKATKRSLNQQLMSLRKRDRTNRNLEGIIDFDSFVFHVFLACRLSIERNTEFYKALFNSFDINGDKSIGYEEIYEIYSIIEAEKGFMSDKEIEEFRFNYCLYTGVPPTRKKVPTHGMSFKRFAEMVVDLSIFSMETIFGKHYTQPNRELF